MVLSNTSGRRGMTLLELILALSLTVMLMAAIGMAVDLSLRTLNRRRGDVEEANLAQAILQLMANDIRAAIAYDPVDFSGVPSLTEGMEGMLPDELGGELPVEGEDPLPEETIVEGEEEQQDIVESVAPPTIPGLRGDSYVLQVDVSRLPRPDQYDMMLANPGVVRTDILSDVKSVTYYLQSAGLLTNDVGQQPEAVAELGGTGLIRRELDRAVAAWAQINGTTNTLEGNAKVIAPEVVYLEFSYFDGFELLYEWDSEVNEGLPVAVRIVIGLQRGGTSAGGFGIMFDDEVPTQTAYQLWVHLPMAEKIEEEELLEETSGEDLSELGL